MHVAAIIPAYNEEATIFQVVTALKQVEAISDIVVVSDGSEDHTAQQAAAAGARVIEHATNRGKAAAVKTGFEATTAPVVLVLDADLMGLQDRHVTALLVPVLNKEVEMAVGVFDDGRIATDLAQVVAPYLSGQRAFRRELLQRMFAAEPAAEVARFGIEVALTRFVHKAGYRVAEVPLGELTHRMKEEKLGLVKGLAARMKMYWEILKYVQRS